jgi:hypothetical protein
MILSLEVEDFMRYRVHSPSIGNFSVKALAFVEIPDSLTAR